MILGKYVGFWMGIDHDRFKIRSPVPAKVGQGVGVMLVSQRISDLDPAMRSAMNISILFRTKYDGDLRAIPRMLGSETSEVIPKLPVGYSVFHLADVRDPFVLSWRPTYSEP